MALSLPITIVAVDNVAHDLTRMALEDTLRQVIPQQVMIFTDAPDRIGIPGAEYHHFDGDYTAAMNTLWYELPHLLRSEHWLWIQWDSWVLDANCWSDEFLRCDYIGAPWPVQPGNEWDKLGYVKGTAVGNGGFSLRSTMLSQEIAEDHARYPLHIPEDDAICRLYRPALEQRGFIWAPEELADKFSVECKPPTHPTFGFHGVFNWGWVLSGGAFDRRVQAASPFVQKSRAFQLMLDWKRNSLVDYNPAIFDVDSLERAKLVILNPDGVHTSGQRWELETEYLLGKIDEYMPRRDATCLDYGCGIGRLAKPLIERKGWAVLGTDISPSMRGFAAGYVSSSHFVCCGLSALDTMIRLGVQVDYAVAPWVLQHCSTPAEDIARIKAALKPGGRLLVLNATSRFVPTKEAPWVDDGIDVWAILAREFTTVICEASDNRIVPVPPSFWGIFENT